MLNPKKILDGMNKMSKLMNDTKEIAVGLVKENNARPTSARTLKQSRIALLERIEELKKRQEWNEASLESLEMLEGLIRASLSKPKMALVGMSDVGKSHLTNKLLGTDKIPSDWSPMTSVNIYIKHVEDRPDFLKEEVIIFSGETEGFDIGRIDDEGYAERHLLAQGDENLLVMHATRSDEEATMSNQARAAVVYLDSPILERCDIIDVPGFGTGDRETDDQYAKNSREVADIILYLSLSNAFMRGPDIGFLKESIEALPVVKNLESSLGNLFVIGSQAHIIGDEQKMNRILDLGAQRFYRTVPQEEWDVRAKETGLSHSESDIRMRFYPYTTNDEKLRSGFEEALNELLETLPRLREEESRKTIDSLVEEQRKAVSMEIKKHRSILDDREAALDRLREIELSEPERQQKTRRHRQEIKTFIGNLMNEDINRFDDVYEEVMKRDNIVRWIEEGKLTKSKEDQQNLVEYLANTLTFRLKEVLKGSTSRFVDRIEGFVGDFEKDVTSPSGFDIGNIANSFNARNAFIGGAAGVASLGGMAAYAATLGNLGAYIIVAKGVGVLSALGVNIGIFGGMPGIMAGIAAIGGPVTIGIALTAVIGLSIYGIMNANAWRDKVAESIRKSFAKNEAKSKFSEEIIKYWGATTISFEAAADELETEWKNHLEMMRQEIKETDSVTIQQHIDELDSYDEFLKDIKGSLSNN
ncbi:hypothetical protein HNY42_03045 [Exiguobacterium sp. Helios]|uniref:dynamin family protein n=1 Tax=Exiguobacterium sp. Helios TaxID=2735868 RepID=UPI00165EAA4A|nr:dynamin family protein [Exiguobacterium sp. Helios]QNR19963.1 hypothetical protein HNY42_03045 [Exiguobacterium sp. Helios]